MKFKKVSLIAMQSKEKPKKLLTVVAIIGAAATVIGATASVVALLMMNSDQRAAIEHTEAIRAQNEMIEQQARREEQLRPLNYSLVKEERTLAYLVKLPGLPDSFNKSLAEEFGVPAYSTKLTVDSGGVGTVKTFHFDGSRISNINTLITYDGNPIDRDGELIRIPSGLPDHLSILAVGEGQVIDVNRLIESNSPAFDYFFVLIESVDGERHLDLIYYEVCFINRYANWSVPVFV